MRIAVIPAYNEEKCLKEVIESTSTQVDRVLVVDDGSSDRTSEIARNAGATVIRHCVNRGLGATLGTGIRAAAEMGGRYIVTLDADGQHLPGEIPLFVAAIDEGHDVVLGSRMIADSKGHMPRMRRIAQRVGNYLTYFLFGILVSDSQSGFRGFSNSAASKLDIRTDRMEVSSEIVSEIRRHRFKWHEVPITAIYTDYSMSKGQSFTVGLKTATKLILHRIKTWS